MATGRNRAGETACYHPARQLVTPFIVFLTYWLYGALITLVVWTVLVPVHLVQISRRRATWRELGERLGANPLPSLPERAGAPRLVIHAVSAGEAASGGAFVAALESERPDWSVVFTCGTQDARLVAATLQRRIPSIEAVIGLPWDRSAPIVRWLRQLAPQAVVVVEPEIWPNLFRACDTAGVPLFLVNAHVYAGDVPRYRLLRRFFADVLRRPVWIAAQGAGDRDDLLAIGAPAASTFVAGNLKFDTAVQATDRPLVHWVRASCGTERLILVGGSTYAAEEACLFDALERLRPRFPALRLIVAPRDVQRAQEVASTALARGLRIVRGSNTGSDGAWDVLVVDRFGELAALYAVGDIALIGGTVTPRGGHNVLEPARHGCAIIVGPHVQHIRDAVLDLESAGGIVHLQDCTPAAFAAAAGRLLSDPSRRVIGERARAYHAAHAGAATRCARAVIADVERRAAEGGLNAAGPSRATREKWRLGASEAES